MKLNINNAEGRRKKTRTRKGIKKMSKAHKLRKLKTKQKSLESLFRQYSDTYKRGSIKSEKKEVFRHKIGRGTSHRMMAQKATANMNERNKLRKEYKKVNKEIKEL